MNKDQLTFKGIRLPENGINEGKFAPGINVERGEDLHMREKNIETIKE